MLSSNKNKNYYLAYDDGNVLIRDWVDGAIQRYDRNQKQWVDDFEMCGIYSGDIPVRILKESEISEWMK